MRKVVVITGASDGIGAELARQWASEGVAVVVAARQAEALEAVAAEVRSRGGQALVVRTDVSDAAQCRALIRATVDQYGRLDTLVLNAGVSAHARLADVATADLPWMERVMTVNFWGAVWCTHAALPHLRASRGQVVGVSSLAGLVGVPGRTAYSASKFALGGFLEALRTEEAAHGVGVTVAYPGVVATAIRHRGFNARGEAAGESGLREEGAMSVVECARLIRRAADARHRDVVMTLQGKVGRWLKLLAPTLVDRMAQRALRRDA